MNDSLLLSLLLVNCKIENSSAFGPENRINLVLLWQVFVQCLLSTFSKFIFYKAKCEIINK
jgi:hypothetical protein